MRTVPFEARPSLSAKMHFVVACTEVQIRLVKDDDCMGKPYFRLKML